MMTFRRLSLAHASCGFHYPWRALLAMVIGCAAVPGAQAGAPVRCLITPGYIGLNPNAQHRFSAVGIDADGVLAAIPGPLVWHTDGRAGSVTGDGLFTASGPYGFYSDTISVTTPEGLQATASVDIIRPQVVNGYSFARAWGNLSSGQLSFPTTVAVAADDSYYVVDSFNHRVQKFSADGRYQFQWGGYGSSVGMFYYPWGIATGPDEAIYVTDRQQNRVQKFAASGHFIRSWGTYGQGFGQFSAPTGIAVSRTNAVYVMDQTNQRVQEFTADGSFVRAWGSRGDGPGQFASPWGIGVDATGSVYVPDCLNHRVQKFSATGQFLLSWGSFGSGDGKFNSPYAVSFDTGGAVCVADYGNKRIQKFTPEGAFVAKLGVPGSREVAGIAAKSTGNMLASDPWNGRVVEIDPAGVVINEIGAPKPPGWLTRCQAVATGPDGAIYVADTYNHRMVKFDKNGSAMLAWGEPGQGPGQFSFPQAVCVGPDGSVFVADNHNSRIQEFDASGVFVSAFGDSGPVQIDRPNGIASDGLGNLYVVEEFTYRILHFTTGGAFVKQFGPGGSTSSAIHGPGSIAADRQGNIYVTEWTTNKIRKYDAAGSLVLSWGDSSTFRNPCGVAVDGDGNVWVSDVNNGRIARYTPNGTLLGRCGSKGGRPAQFFSPYGMAVDALGFVYVTEEGTSRVQQLSPGLRLSTPGEAKTAAATMTVDVVLEDQIVTAGLDELLDCFYVESPSRASGIRVTGQTAQRGERVSLRGRISVHNGEAEMAAQSCVSSGTGTIEPLFIRSSAAGGRALGIQPPVGDPQDLFGLSNVGLLVRIAGRVTDADVVAHSFTLDDGSGRTVTCRTPPSVAVVPSWTLAVVTGISSVQTDLDDTQPVIRVRSADDIAAF